MARKKKVEEDVNSAPEQLRAVRLELPPETHKQLRLEAARQDTSLAALARIAVEEYLAKRKGNSK
jgi:predicted HicB family RNase H-like nuclease